MLKLRTKLLLFAIAVSGIGIGVLAGMADGAYSAICLFVLPLFVALAAASIISDFSSPIAVKSKSVLQSKGVTATGRPSAPRMRTAYRQGRLHQG